MKTFTSGIGQTRARWLFIYGVLFGLLFSSGEGIQLMPFPLSAESKVSKLNAFSREDASKSYAFSIFSSRNSFTSLKAKFQKDADQYLSGEQSTPERSETPDDLCSFAAENFKPARFLHFALVPRSRSKRAPPMI